MNTEFDVNWEFEVAYDISTWGLTFVNNIGDVLKCVRAEIGVEEKES